MSDPFLWYCSVCMINAWDFRGFRNYDFINSGAMSQQDLDQGDS
jgi:hypothetical protein